MFDTWIVDTWIFATWICAIWIFAIWIFDIWICYIWIFAIWIFAIWILATWIFDIWYLDTWYLDTWYLDIWIFDILYSKLCSPEQCACGASQTSEKTGPGFSEHVISEKTLISVLFSLCALCSMPAALRRPQKKALLDFQSMSAALRRPGRHPGGTRGHPGGQRPLRGRNSNPSQLKCKSSLEMLILLRVFEVGVTKYCKFSKKLLAGSRGRTAEPSKGP